MTGVATNESYPSWDDPSWTNPNKTLGKIVDLSPSNNKFSTLFSTFKVLRYTQYEAPRSRFCESTIGQECPLVPAFNGSRDDPTSLPGFSVSYDMNSTYAFTSITANMRIISGDASERSLACVSAVITPVLGQVLRNVLRYLPMVILLSVGFATIFAATFSPWGSLDVFQWTTNWGRDEDLLRLVTPGFADCLQYIQFIVLSGSLSLNYPGFFRPVVSSVAWSALMFNESFVSTIPSKPSAKDGLYVVKSQKALGLDQMRQFVGMASVRDVWAGMMIWLLVIIAAILILIQLGFVARWLYRLVVKVRSQDLREKNRPFSIGNVIRIIFTFFLLPIVSLSMFQLVEATRGPIIGVVMAAFVVVAVIGFACWLTYLFITVRPRAFLFDDLPTVLTYGSLYNTYSDEAAGFAVIQISITLLRGIAIGGVQPSGIAQLVLLAICEIVLALTLNAIRPYPAPTSMNLYHTCLAIIRAMVIFLSVAFAPSLGVSESPRGWIGYIILLLHAAVLVFGFFVNALQTVVEVAARLSGAGGGNEGATRGGLVKVFGLRQLQQRGSRPVNGSRHSMASGAAILATEFEPKSAAGDPERARSLSTSSAILLGRSGGSDGRSSMQDNIDGNNGYSHARHAGQISPSTSEGWDTVSRNGHRSSGVLQTPMGLKHHVEPSDPYYRPPRQRRNTLDLMATMGPGSSSLNSGEGAEGFRGEAVRRLNGSGEVGAIISRRGTPVQTQPGLDRDEHDDLGHGSNNTKTDYYASREVDYYYGVRGPALSSGNRKLKTGPADPTGPVSSATGWFKSLFSRNSKDTTKGFEVVRSGRASSQGLLGDGTQNKSPPAPYQDSPGEQRESNNDRSLSSERPSGDVVDDSDGPLQPYTDGVSDDDFAGRANVSLRPPSLPPLLPLVDAGGEIELPSRSNTPSQSAPLDERHGVGQPPFVPRKSSKRKSGAQPLDFPAAHLSNTASPPSISLPKGSPSHPHHHRVTSSLSSNLFPFGTSTSPSKSDRFSGGTESMVSSRSGLGGASVDEENPRCPSPHRLQGGADDPMRPSSVGYVQQHRASDQIRQVDPNSRPLQEGSTAEFVGVPASHY